MVQVKTAKEKQHDGRAESRSPEAHGAAQKHKQKERQLINMYETVTFGRYPYAMDGEVKPLEWYMYGEDEQSVTLLCKTIVDALSYNAQTYDDIRDYLKNVFEVIAFDDNEKKFVLKTEIPYLGMPEDILFLPDHVIQASPSPMAIMNGCYFLWDVNMDRPLGSYFEAHRFLNPVGAGYSVTLNRMREGGIRPMIIVDKTYFEHV